MVYVQCVFAGYQMLENRILKVSDEPVRDECTELTAINYGKNISAQLFEGSAYRQLRNHR
jgi:hypothetical protein